MSATVIREATAADLDRIVEMAQDFVTTTSYNGVVPSTPTHLRAVAENMLKIGVVFVAERGTEILGMLAAAQFPNFLTGVQTAAETAWWVEPQARGGRTALLLMRAFVQWARVNGAARVEVAARDESLEHFYTHIGFHPGERVFQMEL